MNTSQDQDYVQEDIFEEDEYLFEEDDSDRSVDIRNAIHEELLDAINLMDEMPGEDKVREIVTELVEDYPDVILESEQKRYINDFIDDILKLGPLESYLRDPEVTEIMVNGANLSYVERNGELEEVDMHWRSEEHVKAIADRILSPIKRSISAASPIADGRLTDPPARVHIITAPCSILGTVITIRKFRDMKSAEDLLASETATPEMFEFLRASVQSKRNILVSGRNNSGKTTMLNVATSFIPANERIITIEDAAELKLGHLHVVPLESKPPNREGAGAVEIKELVKSTLRMRPDRVIVGEVRGEEANDMLQAMNTGHDGSMTTIHSNDAAGALDRVLSACMRTSERIDADNVRYQIASAFELIVHMDYLRGRRVISEISQVDGISADGRSFSLTPIFRFEHTGYGANGAEGWFETTGVAPSFIGEFDKNGIEVDLSWIGSGGKL